MSVMTGRPPFTDTPIGGAHFDRPSLVDVIRDRLVRWDVAIPVDRGVAGTNERCIEIPLALEVLRLTEPGWVLDAGAAMNGHLYVDAKPQAHVVHLTQAIASEKMRAEGAEPISYVSADLRDLQIFADGAFDRTVCVSTLEHVGLDNLTYYGTAEQNPDSVWAACAELLRVTRGPILITVPFADAPWTDPKGKFRAWTRADLRRLALTAVPRDVHSRRYAITAHGTWASQFGVATEGSDPVRCICAVKIDAAE